MDDYNIQPEHLHDIISKKDNIKMTVNNALVMFQISPEKKSSGDNFGRSMTIPKYSCITLFANDITFDLLNSHEKCESKIGTKQLNDLDTIIIYMDEKPFVFNRDRSTEKCIKGGN